MTSTTDALKKLQQVDKVILDLVDYEGKEVLKKRIAKVTNPEFQQFIQEVQAIITRTPSSTSLDTTRAERLKSILRDAQYASRGVAGVDVLFAGGERAQLDFAHESWGILHDVVGDSLMRQLLQCCSIFVPVGSPHNISFVQICGPIYGESVQSGKTRRKGAGIISRSKIYHCWKLHEVIEFTREHILNLTDARQRMLATFIGQDFCAKQAEIMGGIVDRFRGCKLTDKLRAVCGRPEQYLTQDTQQKFVPANLVYQYAWGIVSEVFSEDSLGGIRNKSILKKKLRWVVGDLNFGEDIDIATLMKGIKVGDFDWLLPLKDVQNPGGSSRMDSDFHQQPRVPSLKRKLEVGPLTVVSMSKRTKSEDRRAQLQYKLQEHRDLLQRKQDCPRKKLNFEENQLLQKAVRKWIGFIIDEFLLELLTTSFYVCQNSQRDYGCFYFLKPVWNQMTISKQQKVFEEGKFVKISENEAVQMMMGKEFGIPGSSVITKGSGERMIINCKKRQMLEHTKFKSMNTYIKDAGLIEVVRQRSEENPQVMGSHVRNYDEVYLKFLPFVDEVRRMSDNGYGGKFRKVFFFVGDIMDAFDGVDVPRMKVFLNKILGNPHNNVVLVSYNKTVRNRYSDYFYFSF